LPLGDVISKNEYEYAGIKKAGRKHTHTLIRHYNEKFFDLSQII